MATSLGRPAGHPGGTFTHSASRTRFTIDSDEGGMRHRFERARRIAEHPIEFFIGSRHQGRSYLTRIGQYLVQSPAPYYSRRRAWDVSPGYVSDPAPAFDRRITEECLFCHASGTSADPQPIGCEHCHGPTPSTSSGRRLQTLSARDACRRKCATECPSSANSAVTSYPPLIETLDGESSPSRLFWCASGVWSCSRRN